MTQPYRKVRVIRVSWPVDPATVRAALAGDMTALETDASFARLLSVLRDYSCLGDFGQYRGVAEVTPCWELFEPQPGAIPAQGKVGQPQASTNLMVTLHADAAVSQDQFDAVVARLVAAHPWEVPVIEVSEGVLALRPDQPAR